MHQGWALGPLTSFLLASARVGSLRHLRGIKVGHLGQQQTRFSCLSLQWSEGGMAKAALPCCSGMSMYFEDWAVSVPAHILYLAVWPLLHEMGWAARCIQKCYQIKIRKLLGPDERLPQRESYRSYRHLTGSKVPSRSKHFKTCPDQLGELSPHLVTSLPSVHGHALCKEGKGTEGYSVPFPPSLPSHCVNPIQVCLPISTGLCQHKQWQRATGAAIPLMRRGTIRDQFGPENIWKCIKWRHDKSKESIYKNYTCMTSPKYCRTVVGSPLSSPAP